MKTKIIITGIVLLILTGTALKLMSNKRVVEGKIYRPDTEKKILVEADTVAIRGFDKIFVYTGTFTPKRETMIIPQVYGQVRGLYFEEGDVVHQGKLLAVIDDDLLRAQQLAAEANYVNAQRNLERYEKASLGGGVSGMQVDNARLTLKSADAQLRQINKQIALSRIAAPFAGTITLRDVEPGSVVGAQPIARITDMSQLKLEINVPEKEVAHFIIGESVVIETELNPGESISGRIEYIAARADEAHNYLVRITVKNDGSDLKAGMYGTVTIPRSLATEVLAIPRGALLGSAKDPQVFVLQGESVVMRSIETGQSNADYIEVITGLQAEDVVVTSGHINLSNGSLVQVIR